MSATLYYQSGTPDTVGVYACRVPRTDCPPGLYEDVFLMRSEGKWWHLGSDQHYRGEVTSFLGPLARRDGLDPASIERFHACGQCGAFDASVRQHPGNGRWRCNSPGCVAQ